LSACVVTGFIALTVFTSLAVSFTPETAPPGLSMSMRIFVAALVLRRVDQRGANPGSTWRCRRISVRALLLHVHERAAHRDDAHVAVAAVHARRRVGGELATLAAGFGFEHARFERDRRAQRRFVAQPVFLRQIEHSASVKSVFDCAPDAQLVEQVRVRWPARLPS
jgi:hypothetical protein